MKLEIGNLETPSALERERNLAMFSMAVWFTVIVDLVWFAIAIFLELKLGIYLTFVTLVFTAISLFLIKTRFDLLGRCLFGTTNLVAIFVGSFLVHPDGNLSLMFLAVSMGALVSFFDKSEEIYQKFFFFAPIALWIFVDLVDLELFGPPIVDQETARKYLTVPVILTVSSMAILEFSHFKRLSRIALEQLSHSRNEAAAANEAKSAFLANMSHEIRTPMNGVIGMVDVMDGSPLRPEQRRMLSTIKDSSFALLRIIDDILDVSKIEAGKLELQTSSCELLPMVESTVETLIPLADEKNVQISIYIDPSLPRILICDAGRMRQILLNLLSNAVKFSGSDDLNQPGNVHLTIERLGLDRWRIAVEDDGIGMDQEMQSMLFKPFSQSSEGAQRHYGGTGLGLTIVKQLVTKMEGSISVESEVGSGSIFALDLPIVSPEGQIPPQNLSGLTFIYYATDAAMQRKLELYLRYIGGHIRAASSQKELTEFCAKADVASTIVILAVWHPSRRAMADLTLLESLQALYPKLRMLTFTKNRNAESGFVGENHYVQRRSPVLPSEFWEALEQLAGRKKPEIENGDTAVHNAMMNMKQRNLARGALRRPVLIVEDNEINQTVLKQQLEQMGYAAIIAENGQDGLAQWEARDFNLIITDCKMPIMDGYQMTTAIREREIANRRARTPIIAVSANVIHHEQDKCYAAGMDDFISKPFKLEQLAYLLQKWDHEPFESLQQTV